MDWKNNPYVGQSSTRVPLDIGAKYAILPGDPDRVEKIAAHLDNPRFVARHREYTSWVGELEGEPVLVISTGMGGPSAAICVEELHMLGCDTIIRLGTCGGMQTAIDAGDRVVATAAIRQEGTTNQYIYPEYPAVADFSVTRALQEASNKFSYKTWTGVVQSKDSLFGQHQPQRMPVKDELQTKYQAWIDAGALGSEMECAAVFVVAGVLGMRAGAVLHVIWNREKDKIGEEVLTVSDMSPAIETAIEAIRILMKEDK